jgi:hypothetical protein
MQDGWVQVIQRGRDLRHDVQHLPSARYGALPPSDLHGHRRGWLRSVPRQARSPVGPLPYRFAWYSIAQLSTMQAVFAALPPDHGDGRPQSHDSLAHNSTLQGSQHEPIRCRNTQPRPPWRWAAACEARRAEGRRAMFP